MTKYQVQHPDGRWGLFLDEGDAKRWAAKFPGAVVVAITRTVAVGVRGLDQ